LATSFAPFPADAKIKAMVVMARIQSNGAVFAGIDILQSKLQFPREKKRIDEETKGCARWEGLKLTKGSRNLIFTYIEPPLVRQHYFCGLHNSQSREQATRKRASLGSILAIGSRVPRL
jgi:hypothetical protein